MSATATSCSERGRWRHRVAVAALSALAGGSACAALGDGVDSIAADQARLGATRRQTQAAAVPVHTLQWPDGSAVRQYVGADGRVFAVAWNTRGKPRLDQLLGSYHERYAAAVRRSAAGHPGVRHGGTWRDGDLVVESSGHGSAFVGRAYLTSKLPPGQGRESVR